MIHALQSLILYLSDDPDKFKYFSDSFDTRIQHIPYVQFTQDKKVENELLYQLNQKKDDFNFENYIQQNIHVLRLEIQKKQLLEAEKTSNKLLYDYEQKLLENPYTLSSKTRAEFYFWNTIAHLSTSTPYELIADFLHSATLEQKNFLESQLSKDIYIKYLHVIQKFKTLKRKVFTIQNHSKCSLFINGKQHLDTTLTLPSIHRTILYASCTDGFYATLLTNQSDLSTTIKITPSINKSLAQPPILSNIRLNSIKNSQYKYITLIYWSKKSQYLHINIAALPDFHKKYTLLLHLKAKGDLQMAGNKIFEFISNHFRDLIELDTF